MKCTPKVFCLTFGVHFILRQPLFICSKMFTQLYTLLYQRLCIMIGYTNNNEFTPRLTFAHRTYSLDLAERNTKCATISVYLADIASLKIICINWYCF